MKNETIKKLIRRQVHVEGSRGDYFGRILDIEANYVILESYFEYLPEDKIKDAGISIQPEFHTDGILLNKDFVEMIRPI